MTEPRTADHSHAARRRWADVVVIVAALYVFLAAVWSPPELISRGEGHEVGSTNWLFIAYGLGGSLGLAGLLAAQRHTLTGRILVGLGGLLVLSGFAAMREVTLLAAISIGGSGLAMLIAAPFVGAMPSPEEEGRTR